LRWRDRLRRRFHAGLRRIVRHTIEPGPLCRKLGLCLCGCQFGLFGLLDLDAVCGLAGGNPCDFPCATGSLFGSGREVFFVKFFLLNGQRMVVVGINGIVYCPEQVTTWATNSVRCVVFSALRTIFGEHG
jgi:hypothetical protein